MGLMPKTVAFISFFSLSQQLDPKHSPKLKRNPGQNPTPKPDPKPNHDPHSEKVYGW